jgi:hypothetical protein
MAGLDIILEESRPVLFLRLFRLVEYDLRKAEGWRGHTVNPGGRTRGALDFSLHNSAFGVWIHLRKAEGWGETISRCFSVM